MKTLFAALCLLIAPFTHAQNADWSGLFKSWEQGCRVEEDGSPFSELESSLQDFIDQKTAPQADVRPNIKLPAAYRAQAASRPTFHRVTIDKSKHNNTAYTIDQIRLALKGTYYGLPVVHYSRTFHLETAGIVHYRLLLDTPIAQARRVLAGKYKKRRYTNPVLEGGTEILQAELLPANINGKQQTILQCVMTYG